MRTPWFDVGGQQVGDRALFACGLIRVWAVSKGAACRLTWRCSGLAALAFARAARFARSARR